MKEYVYVIIVQPKKPRAVAARISGEAYSNLTQAQAFISTRSDRPKRFTEFIYESEENFYFIHELKVFLCP